MAGGVTLMYCATLLVGTAVAVFSTVPDKALTWALRIGLVIASAGLSVGFLMVIPTAAQLADPTAGRTARTRSVVTTPPAASPSSGGTPSTATSVCRTSSACTRCRCCRSSRSPSAGRCASGHASASSSSPGATYAAVTAIALWQALRGQSVLHPDVLTIGATGIVVLVVAGLVTSVLLTRRQGTVGARSGAIGRAGQPIQARDGDD